MNIKNNLDINKLQRITSPTNLNINNDKEILLSSPDNEVNIRKKSNNINNFSERKNEEGLLYYLCFINLIKIYFIYMD